LVAQGTDRARLDDQRHLESVGICPNVVCTSRGTARVTDAGGNDWLRWGRWIDGTSYLTVAGIKIPRRLGVNDGLHYLVGTPTVTMPTSGDASYRLTGSTAPTFTSGTHAPGVMTGNARVQFGSGQATRVGIDAAVQFSDGTRYRMESRGGLADVGQTELRMNGRTTFAGNIAARPATIDPLACGSNCRANVNGGFFGPGARMLGFQYSIGATSGATTGPGARVPQTGDTITGVGAMTTGD